MSVQKDTSPQLRGKGRFLAWKVVKRCAQSSRLEKPDFQLPVESLVGNSKQSLKC